MGVKILKNSDSYTLIREDGRERYILDGVIVDYPSDNAQARERAEILVQKVLKGKYRIKNWLISLHNDVTEFYVRKIFIPPRKLGKYYLCNVLTCLTMSARYCDETGKVVAEFEINDDKPGALVVGRLTPEEYDEEVNWHVAQRVIENVEYIMHVLDEVDARVTGLNSVELDRALKFGCFETKRVSLGLVWNEKKDAFDLRVCDVVLRNGVANLIIPLESLEEFLTRGCDEWGNTTNGVKKEWIVKFPNEEYMKRHLRSVTYAFDDDTETYDESLIVYDTDDYVFEVDTIKKFVFIRAKKTMRSYALAFENFGKLKDLQKEGII